ncbi:MAG: DNA polymerase III subunit gamma/tau, partial [Cyanobacteria bacterium P01_C01_bin.38]
VVEFNGSMARVAIKEKWFDKVKEQKSNIKAAFQVTFKKEIEVNLEEANANSVINSNSSAATPTVQQQNVTPTPVKPQTAPQPAPQPAPAPLPTPEQPPLTRTTPAVQPAAVSNTAPPPQTTPTQAQPTPIAEDPEASELMKAAKRLAQALDGEIIKLNEENTETSDEPIDSSELEVIEDDVEF